MVVDSSALLAKYLGEKEGNSLKFMQRMIYLIFSEVVYQRELLPRDHFTEKHVFGCALHVPDTSRDRRQVALHNHLKGAAAALTDKKLKQYHLMVHKCREDPSAADEVFIMDVVYAEDDGDDASMHMSCGELAEVRVRYGGVEELQKQTRDVFRSLRRGLSTLEPITRNVSFSFYITYRDGVDRAYHPAGYGQAARMYDLPQTAEIGDMGMLHAKEHACLLKVKSMMLEDGFQLMQRNVATQRTNSQPLSADSSQEDSAELLSSDKASSLGVFDYASEWDEAERSTKEDQRSKDKKDQRSTEKKDQRSLGGDAPHRQERMEQSPISAERSLFSDDSEASSRELGTATADDFFHASLGAASVLAPLSQPTAAAAAAAGGDTTAESNPIATFASTVSIVTKKLAAADKRREEEEEQREKEKEASPAASAPSNPSDVSQASSVDASSEGSEKAPEPVRRVSLRKRLSHTKAPESSTTGSSDDRPTEESAEDPKSPPPAKAKKAKVPSSSAKEADSEASAATVAHTVVMERRRSARGRASMDKSATVPVEEAEKEIVTPAAKKPRGRKSKDTVTPQPESVDTEAASEKTSGRKGRAAKAAAKDTVTPREESMDTESATENQTGRKGRAARGAVREKDTVPPQEEKMDTEEKSGARKGKAKILDETPKRGTKRQPEPPKEHRTPGEGTKQYKYSQDRATVAETTM